MHNYSTAVFLINKNLRAIACTYERDTDTKKAERVTFKSFDTEIIVGDYVIVETDTRHGMTVNRVVEVDVEPDLDSSSQMKWIVSRVDTIAHDRVKRQEEQAIAVIKSAEKNRRREELAKSMILDPDRIKTLAIAGMGEQDTPTKE